MKPNTYMLWQFDVKNELSKEIEKALEHYKKKFGNPPSIVLLNPKWEETKLPENMTIVVKSYRPVLANLMWIGE